VCHGDLSEPKPHCYEKERPVQCYLSVLPGLTLPRAVLSLSYLCNTALMSTDQAAELNFQNAPKAAIKEQVKKRKMKN